MTIIELTVAPDGATTIAAKGYAGSGCQAATRFLEEALGTKGTDQPTPEMYQTTPTTQRIRS